MRLSVRVEDAGGNPLGHMKIALSSDRGAVITPVQLVSGSDGVAHAMLTATQAGEVNVVARLDNAVSKTLSLQAVADTQTATVGVKSSTATATAGQSDPVVLTATVVDSHNNPVADTSVAWQSSHNQLNHAVSITNAKGEAVVQLSAQKRN